MADQEQLMLLQRQGSETVHSHIFVQPFAPRVHPVCELHRQGESYDTTLIYIHVIPKVETYRKWMLGKERFQSHPDVNTARGCKVQRDRAREWNQIPDLLAKSVSH